MSPNGGGCSTHSSGSGYGENLAWFSGTFTGPDFGYNDAAQSWYNYNNNMRISHTPDIEHGAADRMPDRYSEVKYWNYGSSSGNGGGATGCEKLEHIRKSPY